MANLGDAVITIRSRDTQAQRSQKRLRRELSRTRRELKAYGRSIRNATFTLTAFAAGVAAIASVAGSIVGNFTRFEAQMNRVRAVTGATNEEMRQLQRLAQDLGATTRFTAVEAAEGLAFLGQAGLTASEQLTALPQVLTLAAAGGLELGEAADISTNILGAFNEEVGQLGRFVDVLASAAASSNTNIQQLGEAMRYAAPVANLVGASVERTAAALGVLADSGIQATSGGTALRQVLLRLQAPAGEAAKALEDLGVRTVNSSGEVRDFVDILRDMAAAGADVQDFEAVFGIRFAGAASIIANTSDRVDELTEKYNEATGAAERMTEILLEGLSGALKNFGSAAEGVSNQIGATLAPQLQDSVEQWTRVLRAIREAFRGETFALEDDLDLEERVTALRGELDRITLEGTQFNNYGRNVQAQLRIAERALEDHQRELAAQAAQRRDPVFQEEEQARRSAEIRARVVREQQEAAEKLAAAQQQAEQAAIARAEQLAAVRNRAAFEALAIEADLNRERISGTELLRTQLQLEQARVNATALAVTEQQRLIDEAARIAAFELPAPPPPPEPPDFEAYDRGIRQVREQTAQLRTAVAVNLVNGFADFVTGAILGFNSIADAGRNLVRLLLTEFTRLLAVQPLIRALGGAIGVDIAGLRHFGGPVRRGQPYLVGGGRGEELFVPEQSGRIISNRDLRSGGGDVNINFEIVGNPNPDNLMDRLRTEGVPIIREVIRRERYQRA